jgi:hypothetical protein
MSKKHKEHDCGDTKELDGLMGTALATKLMRDTVQSANETDKVLTKAVLDSLKLRKELAADELTHLTPEAREEALTLLKQEHVEMLSCGMMRLSAMMGFTLGDSIATFVGHAANHFEMERTRSVVESIFGSARESSAQTIKDAAASITGTDN